MTLLYPLGLLGLIGVPVLIIIYIIKNKYTEQVVTSTYLWTLSEKFLKKRLPINKLVGLISLILQILAVILVSFAVAHPVLLIANAAHDYCFILDGSGSMNIVQEDKTRLQLAKDEISAIINESSNGSAYSLVFVGKDTSEIYSGVTDKQRALSLLENITSDYTSAGFTDAIGTAQKYFNENTSLVTYLVTDKDFEETQNVTLINVASAVENYALADVGYSLDGGLKITGNVISYQSDANLTVELYIDGMPAPNYVQDVKAGKLEAVPFTFDCLETNFNSFKVVIAQTDALAEDNEVTVFNVEYENSYTVLLVSETPFYMQAVLKAVGNARVDVIDPVEYVSGDGYDLCVYDSFTPETLPENSSVWFFNPTASVAKSGFTVQDEITESTAVKMSYTNTTSTIVKTLLKDVIKEDVYVKKYQKCGLYLNFTVLISSGDSPLVFTGTNEYGNRTVVFAFALSDSNFPPLQDYRILAGNLLSFAFPAVIENSSYNCGESLQINVLSNCDSIRVDSPSGKITYLDTSGTIAELELTDVGTYTITCTSGDSARVYNVYSSFPADESIPLVTEEYFGLSGEAGNQRRSGIYDNLLALFIVLAVIFAADWVVYCYEQYQLR